MITLSRCRWLKWLAVVNVEAGKYDDGDKNASEEYDDGDENVSKEYHLRLTDGLSDCLWELSHVGVLHIL